MEQLTDPCLTRIHPCPVEPLLQMPKTRQHMFLFVKAAENRTPHVQASSKINGDYEDFKQWPRLCLETI